MEPRYGRLGACDGDGVKPGIVGGVPGNVVCGVVTLFDATRVGPCPTPKANVLAAWPSGSKHPECARFYRKHCLICEEPMERKTSVSLCVVNESAATL